MSSTSSTSIPTLPSTADAIDRAVHDLNNVCATIFGFATLAGDGVQPGSALEQYLAEINAAGERANTLSQQLHQLSKEIRRAAAAK
jgi:signal transduction histidine kinase